MSVGVLFAGTMLVCCLGLITGGPEDEEQKRYVVNFHFMYNICCHKLCDLGNILIFCHSTK